jgi:hypothetical protein
VSPFPPVGRFGLRVPLRRFGDLRSRLLNHGASLIDGLFQLDVGGGIGCGERLPVDVLGFAQDGVECFKKFDLLL